MSIPTITIYVLQDTPRLRYVLDWLFTEQLRIGYHLTTDSGTADVTYCLFYGINKGRLSMPSAGLLSETSIRPIKIPTGNWKELDTLYHYEGLGFVLPFDLFSAIFYLLSRYEEYADYEQDKHGRYPHQQSILYKLGILETPIIDKWVYQFRLLLEEHFSIRLPCNPFKFKPTYDIDIAWSYLHKSPKRLLAASVRDVLYGRFKIVSERIAVVSGKKADPYDSFLWLKELHEVHNLACHYFILATGHSSLFDKNIPPLHPAMEVLIKSLASEGALGLHPSYFTDQNFQKLLSEKTVLSQIAGLDITTSRQHYIRLFMPATYRALMAAGIEKDYSMGYATALGFRAGTSHSFLWYDLEQEKHTAFRVYPFCFMDTTAHYDLGLNTATAFLRLRQITCQLQACGGVLITVFHNFSLGSDNVWNGWKDAYQGFIMEVGVSSHQA